MTHRNALVSLAFFVVLGAALGVWTVNERQRSPVLEPALQLIADEARDQDDICVWQHPDTAEKSLVISSDKAAHRIFTYDLNGNLIQSIPASKPGNIDIRQGVEFGDATYDVVVVNQREPETMLRVYFIDAASRMLRQVDDQIVTADNYGGCLFYDDQAKRLYFITTSMSGLTNQYELTLNDAGRVEGTLVRTWTIGFSEGAVAHDASQTLFIAEEHGNIWKLGALPNATTPGKVLTSVGNKGLRGDLEGVALLSHPGYEKPLLIVSDQGRSRFVILATSKPATKLAEFAIRGAVETDGIEVHQQPLGSRFPEGIFVCHTDRGRRTPLVVDLRQVLALIDQD